MDKKMLKIKNMEGLPYTGPKNVRYVSLVCFYPLQKDLLFTQVLTTYEK